MGQSGDMITRALLAVFLVLLLGLFSFFAISLQNEKVLPVKSQKGKALILEGDLYTIDGQSVDKKILLSEKVILNVYASYCLPCVIEHPFLMEIAELKDIKIIGISYKDQVLDTKEYLERLGDPYDFSILDLEGNLSLKLGVIGPPETFLIIDGEIVAHRIGVIDINIWNDEFAKYF